MSTSQSEQEAQERRNKGAQQEATAQVRGAGGWEASERLTWLASFCNNAKGKKGGSGRMSKAQNICFILKPSLGEQVVIFSEDTILVVRVS
jgi:hypothetical protein